MRTAYIRDLDDYLVSQEEFVHELFDYLIAHGATADRWSSLIFCAKHLDALFGVISYTNMLSAPILQFLSLRWKTRMDFWDADPEEAFAGYLDPSDTEHLITGPQMPQLRSVDLNALPTFYLFDRSVPLLSGLTHLALTVVHHLYPLPKLHALLSSNLQLQSLDLSSGLHAQYGFEPTALRVQLPSLRSFSFSSEEESSWGLAIMQMIDAPALERLQLAQADDLGSISKLVQYITTGSSNNQVPDFWQADHSSGLITYAPIYPTLRELDIEYIYRADIPTIRVLLSAFTTATRVALPFRAIELLGDAPWVLPNLVCIRTGFPEQTGTLLRILRRREEAGYHVKKVEMLRGLGEYLRDDWPGSVDVARRSPAPYDSDSDNTPLD